MQNLDNQHMRDKNVTVQFKWKFHSLKVLKWMTRVVETEDQRYFKKKSL